MRKKLDPERLNVLKLKVFKLVVEELSRTPLTEAEVLEVGTIVADQTVLLVKKAVELKNEEQFIQHE